MSCLSVVVRSHSIQYQCQQLERASTTFSFYTDKNEGIEEVITPLECLVV